MKINEVCIFPANGGTTMMACRTLMIASLIRSHQPNMLVMPTIRTNLSHFTPPSD